MLIVGGCSSGSTATAAATTSVVATATPVATAAVTTTPATTAKPTPSPSPTAGPTAVPSAKPGQLLSSTVEMFVQPDGSIAIEMHGPPPVFTPNDLKATAGEVTFFLKNTSPGRDPHGVHSLAIGPDLKHPIVESAPIDGARRAAFKVYDLPAGEYVIWCTFPDHANLGQTGTLVVE